MEEFGAECKQCVKMELNGNEVDRIDETEWIERRKHEIILQKYRQNTQRLIKEFQLKIQQQNQQIRLLAKEVKRQKFIIDTFANGSIETLTLESHEPQPQIVADHSTTRNVQTVLPNPEATTIIYLNDSDVDNLNNGYQNVKVKSDSQPKRFQVKPKINRIHKIENTRKKSSLVAIQIQPNLRNSTNACVCDECNKTMSSRRVLAVCIFTVI